MYYQRCLALIVLLTLSTVASAQPQKLPVIPTPWDEQPRKLLYRYLQAQAQKHFDARRAEVAALKTPEEVRQRQERLKGKMIEALGGFPARTPLNARVVGKAQRDGYHIEKVIFESRPQHHVTATLYIPDGKGPFPGVLMPIGHSSNGKAAEYIQKGSILLARNGLAVLAYDPIGQGERLQLTDAQRQGEKIGSTTEHTLVGVGALLIGESTATYRIWDGMRALDYLASRPEVDAKRLGCTGCSGGGTLTSYLMALDERIQAAAPSCYITSLERLFATLGPQDAEQNITGQVAFGLDHADYLTMRAPRATLICAATRDFFDIGGTWTSFREATLLYGILGHSERINLVEYDTRHGYPKPQREAVARWMQRWLLQKDDAVVEGDIKIVPDRELYCTRSGQVLEELQGKSAFDLSAEKAALLAKKRPQRAPEELQREVRRLLGGMPEKIAAAKELPNPERPIFETEPGIKVPGWHFIPVNPVAGSPLVLYIHGRGMAAGSEAVEQLVKAGKEVLMLDPRGIGETAPAPLSARPGYFGVDFKESFLALHLNRPLLGQRTYDILSVVEVLSQKKEYAKRPLHIVGVGSAAPIVLHAAALDSRLKEVVIEDGVLSWEAVVNSPISHNQLTNVVPGALKVYDLPELAALVAPRPLTLRGVVDPKGMPVTQAILERANAPTQTAYARAQARERLVLTGQK